MKPCLLQKLILILVQLMLEGWGGGGGKGNSVRADLLQDRPSF